MLFGNSVDCWMWELQIKVPMQANFASLVDFFKVIQCRANLCFSEMNNWQCTALSDERHLFFWAKNFYCLWLSLTLIFRYHWYILSKAKQYKNDSFKLICSVDLQQWATKYRLISHEVIELMPAILVHIRVL